MDKDRFHRAARDGYLDLLRETTRRDCNEPDEDGFSPTIWACYYGKLDALRLLVGRGGDPDKKDHLGNSALHWSAANGHFECVSFLVNFGCNIWSLNNDFQTAKDFAALRNHKIILDFLDSMMAKQSALNPKLVQKSKERAVIEAEKRIKLFEKIQRKATKKAEKEEKQNERNRRKLLEPIQITNNRLQCSTISGRSGGTLRWTVKSKTKKKDVPLKFSDLVNNTNTIQRTNQFNNLMANVKGTLNGSTSLSLVRSLGAVSKKVQLKKHSSTTSSSSGSTVQQQSNEKQIKHTDEINKPNNQDQYAQLNGQQSAIESQVRVNSTVRSITALCHDTDVLYVRKENYGLSPLDLKQLHQSDKSNSAPSSSPLQSQKSSNNNNLNESGSDVDKNSAAKESEPGEKEKEENRTSKAIKNSSLKSLDNNNNTKQNETVNRAKLKLKELFLHVKASDTTDSHYLRNQGKTTKRNSINKMSTLLKKGLTRATSESDLVFELKRGESKLSMGTTMKDHQKTSDILNDSTTRSKLLQSTTKLNGSLNGSIFERPGFGSIGFRHNLFAQVLQLSKQLNEMDSCAERRSLAASSSFNKTQIQHTNRLQLMERMNKQLRNELENDSIGNSLSSRSTNSSNSSTNSTLSSNLIETELTDDLSVKLSSKTQFKTRKSLKSIQSANHDMSEESSDLQQTNVQTEQFDKQLDNQANDRQQLVLTVESTVNEQQYEQQVGADQTVTQSNQQVDQKLKEVMADQSKDDLVKQKDNQLVRSELCDMIVEKDEKLDQKSNSKSIDNSEPCQRKSTNNKKYHETYERLNGQTLNRPNKQARQTMNDKIYEKKNAKLLKIKDKFLSRMNARQDAEKDRSECDAMSQANHLNRETSPINDSSNDSSDLILKNSSSSQLSCSSNNSSKNNSLNKKIDGQQSDDGSIEESWQDARTEIAIACIEKKSKICTSNDSYTTIAPHDTHNLIENRIKKFENINRQQCSNGVYAFYTGAKRSPLREDSHVFKLMVKNRESNESNSLAAPTTINSSFSTITRTLPLTVKPASQPINLPKTSSLSTTSTWNTFSNNNRTPNIGPSTSCLPVLDHHF